MKRPERSAIVFKIYWTHFHYETPGFKSLEAARQYGFNAHFDHQIYKGDKLVGYWTVGGGWHAII